jgi:hypothetical protein
MKPLVISVLFQQIVGTLFWVFVICFFALIIWIEAEETVESAKVTGSSDVNRTSIPKWILGQMVVHLILFLSVYLIGKIWGWW